MSAVQLILLKPANLGSLWHVTGMADFWGMSFFPSPEAFLVFYSFLWLMLLAVACYFMMPRDKPQVGVRAGAEAGPAWEGRPCPSRAWPAWARRLGAGTGLALAMPWVYGCC